MYMVLKQEGNSVIVASVTELEGNELDHIESDSFEEARKQWGFRDGQYAKSADGSICGYTAELAQKMLEEFQSRALLAGYDVFEDGTEQWAAEKDIDIEKMKKIAEADSTITDEEALSFIDSFQPEEKEMFYGEYKRNFSRCKTKKDSYDPEKKTIIVYVEKF